MSNLNKLTAKHLATFRGILLAQSGKHFQEGITMPNPAYYGIVNPENITLFNVCDESMRVQLILCRAPERTDNNEPELIKRAFAESQAAKDGYSVAVLLIGNYMD